MWYFWWSYRIFCKVVPCEVEGALRDKSLFGQWTTRNLNKSWPDYRTLKDKTRSPRFIPLLSPPRIGRKHKQAGEEWTKQFTTYQTWTNKIKVTSTSFMKSNDIKMIQSLSKTCNQPWAICYHIPETTRKCLRNVTSYSQAY